MDGPDAACGACAALGVAAAVTAAGIAEFGRTPTGVVAAVLAVCRCETGLAAETPMLLPVGCCTVAAARGVLADGDGRGASEDRPDRAAPALAVRADRLEAALCGRLAPAEWASVADAALESLPVSAEATERGPARKRPTANAAAPVCDAFLLLLAAAARDR